MSRKEADQGGPASLERTRAYSSPWVVLTYSLFGTHMAGFQTEEKADRFFRDVKKEGLGVPAKFRRCEVKP